MNHHATMSNVYVTYNLRRGGFAVRTTRAIKRGEELLTSYGAALCREYALSLYGFAEAGMKPCPRPAAQPVVG